MKKNKYKIIILTVLTLIIVVLALKTFAQPYRLQGDCMEPTIRSGKLYFLNRILPYIRKYQTDDVILFKYEGKVWISRIVALEADIIQITEGAVVVNGFTLKNAGIHRNWSGWKQGAYAIDKPFEVPLDHVFVLSDNLAAKHDDSRVFGPVSNESILGLVW